MITESCLVTVDGYLWVVVLGLMALWDSISVYTKSSPIEREKEEEKDIYKRKNSQTTPFHTYCKYSRPKSTCQERVSGENILI